MTTAPASDAQFGHFQQLYARDDDPWNVRASWYEQRKRSVLLASLPRLRYEHAFEPACGTGELTAALALRTARLLAGDLSPQAVELARRRLAEDGAGTAHVAVHCQRVPEQWPDDTDFDLIVVSEMAYYLDETAMLALRTRCAASLAPDGTLVLCHWRLPFGDRRLATELIHDTFDLTPGLRHVVRHVDEQFLLDVWCAGVQPDGDQENTGSAP